MQAKRFLPDTAQSHPQGVRRPLEEEAAPMKVRKLSKKATVVTMFLGAMLAGSVAFAYWTATGTGNGYAEAGTSTDLSTNATATIADLYPGVDGDLFIDIENPNPYPVLVTEIARTGDPITSDAGGACDASTGVSMADLTGLSLSVPAGGNASFQLDDVVSMSNASDDSCQGAIFTIPVQLTGRSDA
jgi:hypothetical protein